EQPKAERRRRNAAALRVLSARFCEAWLSERVELLCHVCPDRRRHQRGPNSRLQFSVHRPFPGKVDVRLRSLSGAPLLQNDGEVIVPLGRSLQDELTALFASNRRDS